MKKAQHYKNSEDVDLSVEKKRTKAGKICSRILWQLGATLFFLMTALLVFFVITRTVIFKDQSQEFATILYWSDNYGALLITEGFIAAILMVGILFVIYKFGSYFNLAAVLIVFIILSLFFSMHALFGAKLGTHGFNDSMSLIKYASDIVTNGWNTINPNDVSHDAAIPTAYDYFSLYPFQVGCFLYFVFIFKLFGAWNVFALEMANVIANEVAVLALIGVAFQMTASKQIKIASIVAISSSAPFLISASFPYGNSVGFAFICLFLCAQVKSLKAREVGRETIWQIISLVPLGFGVMIKPTFILIVLGILIARIVDTFRSRRLLQLIIITSIFIISRFMVNLPTTWVENRLQLNFGRGMPSSAWMEIGLSSSETLDDQPGWWDPTAIDNYYLTNGDYEKQDKLAKKGIEKSIDTFIKDPFYFLNFMSGKLSTEWVEPTYQSLMFYGLNADFNGRLTGYTAYQSMPITAYMRGYQIVLYIGSLLEAIFICFCSSNKKVDFSYLIYCIVFVGFACYLIWEAKSLYVQPFSMIMTLVAVRGYYHFFGLMNKKLVNKRLINKRLIS